MPHGRYRGRPITPGSANATRALRIVSPEKHGDARRSREGDLWPATAREDRGRCRPQDAIGAFLPEHAPQHDLPDRAAWTQLSNGRPAGSRRRPSGVERKLSLRRGKWRIRRGKWRIMPPEAEGEGPHQTWSIGDPRFF